MIIANKKNVIRAGIFILLITLIVIIIARTSKKIRKMEERIKEAGTKQDSPNIDTNLALENFPLKLGSRGKKVEQLQLYLKNKRGAKFPKGGIDGTFGPETLANVKGFLNVDEISEDIFKDKRMSDFKTFIYSWTTQK